MSYNHRAVFCNFSYNSRNIALTSGDGQHLASVNEDDSSLFLVLLKVSSSFVCLCAHTCTCINILSSILNASLFETKRLLLTSRLAHYPINLRLLLSCTPNIVLSWLLLWTVFFPMTFHLITYSVTLIMKCITLDVGPFLSCQHFTKLPFPFKFSEL